MKYKTFRALVVGSAVVVGVAGLYGVRSCQRDRDAQQAQQQEIERQERAERERKAGEAAFKAAQEERARTAAAVTQAALAKDDPAAFFKSTPGLRPVDQDVLALLKSRVQPKIKDATRGKKYKVNLYADDGKRWNRAKVDLDRDEKSDESWTFHDDGRIERKVAPADDENYTETLRLDVTAGWIDVAATKSVAVPPPSPTPSSAPSSAPSAGAGLRAVDRDMQALLSSPVQEKIKDATKGKPYKINLYSDDGTRFNRAKVDLDRDDKWDESWTFKDGQTERQVSPADDEKYSEVWVLDGSSWRKK